MIMQALDINYLVEPFFGKILARDSQKRSQRPKEGVITQVV